MESARINQNMDSTPQIMKRHYFDWAATAAPDPAAFFTENYPAIENIPFGNPSSRHSEGRTAKQALENARKRCAAILGVEPQTLYFTSGGTESNCIPLFSCLARQGSGRLLASLGEHASVSENLNILERLGKRVGRIPIDSKGKVSEAILAQTLEKYPDTCFAAIIGVNNEVGSINNLTALRDVLSRKNGAPIHLHCDMVQATGKIPIDIAGWGIDSASFSAHKIGGPRGIGLLYLRRPLEILCSGGGQENKIRPGTENVAGALAFASCLEKHASADNLAMEMAKARTRCVKLLSGLKGIERCQIIPMERGIDDEGFSPYIVQAAFKGIPGEVMARALDDHGFAVSTGSACSSALTQHSQEQQRPILFAMGIEKSLSLEGIRISQGWSTTDEDIEQLLQAISEVLQLL